MVGRGGYFTGGFMGNVGPAKRLCQVAISTEYSRVGADWGWSGYGGPERVGEIGYGYEY